MRGWCHKTQVSSFKLCRHKEEDHRIITMVFLFFYVFIWASLWYLRKVISVPQMHFIDDLFLHPRSMHVLFLRFPPPIFPKDTLLWPRPAKEDLRERVVADSSCSSLISRTCCRRLCASLWRNLECKAFAPSWTNTLYAEKTFASATAKKNERHLTSHLYVFMSSWKDVRLSRWLFATSTAPVKLLFDYIEPSLTFILLVLVEKAWSLHHLHLVVNVASNRFGTWRRDPAVTYQKLSSLKASGATYCLE